MHEKKVVFPPSVRTIGSLERVKEKVLLLDLVKVEKECRDSL